jgi:hypothetical protein
VIVVVVVAMAVAAGKPNAHLRIVGSPSQYLFSCVFVTKMKSRRRRRCRPGLHRNSGEHELRALSCIGTRDACN